MNSEVVYSNVTGTIISIRPNGSDVKKGEVVCELDSPDLRDQLINQRITVLSSKAIFENAKVTRETAEIAVIEYEEGIYKFQLDEVDGDIKIAKAELALAEDELKSTKEVVRKGLASEYKFKRTELGVLRAEIALEKALSRQKMLRNFTGPRKTKKLKSNVETARSNERAKNATWELEVMKAKKLERQIAACVIKAPLDGKLNYNRESMGEGIVVGEHEYLFAITPASAPNPKAE
jgi:HlyD family secretion protein